MKKLSFLLCFLYPILTFAQPRSGPYPQPSGGGGSTIITSNNIITSVSTTTYPNIDSAESALETSGIYNGTILLGPGFFNVTNQVFNNVIGASPSLTIITSYYSNTLGESFHIQFSVTNNSYLGFFSLNNGRPDYASNEWTAIGLDYGGASQTIITNVLMKNVWVGVNGNSGIDNVVFSGIGAYGTIDTCDFETRSNGWDNFAVLNNGGVGFDVVDTKMVTIGPNPSAGNFDQAHNFSLSVPLPSLTKSNNYIRVSGGRFLASNTNSVNMFCGGPNSSYKIEWSGGAIVLNTNLDGKALVTNVFIDGTAAKTASLRIYGCDMDYNNVFPKVTPYYFNSSSTNGYILSGSILAATNIAGYGLITNPITTGGFWTNTTGGRITLNINYTLTDAVSGDPGLNMTNLGNGDWFNATNSSAVASIFSDRVSFDMSTNDFIVVTNKSSGSAASAVNGSFITIK